MIWLDQGLYDFSMMPTLFNSLVLCLRYADDDAWWGFNIMLEYMGSPGQLHKHVCVLVAELFQVLTLGWAEVLDKCWLCITTHSTTLAAVKVLGWSHH